MQKMKKVVERRPVALGSVESTLKERSSVTVSVGSKRQRELAVDSSEKRPRTVTNCSLTRQCSDLLKAMKKKNEVQLLQTEPTSADEFSTSKQALRAAMVKCRFADAILKARDKKKLLDKEKTDSTKTEQEMGTFKRRLREEKATSKRKLPVGNRKIKAQLTTTNVRSKTRWETDRIAARIALENMENTAGIELNVEIEKELDILSGFSLSAENPLHNLGLHLKDENLEFEDIKADEIDSDSKKKAEIELQKQWEREQIAARLAFKLLCSFCSV